MARGCTGVNWQPSTIDIVLDKPQKIRAMVYRGLGLFLVEQRKGLEPAKWSLTHLGSGHRVGLIPGDELDVFKVATEIAECGDWEFSGLRGYQNMDPSLPAKALEIIARYSLERGRIKVGDGRDVDERAAAEISMGRMN